MAYQPRRLTDKHSPDHRHNAIPTVVIHWARGARAADLVARASDTRTDERGWWLGWCWSRWCQWQWQPWDHTMMTALCHHRGCSWVLRCYARV